MPEVVTDIIVSPVTVYYGTLAATLPADTVAVGGAWPAGWTKVGFTKESLKAAYEYDSLDVMIQQSLAAVRRRKTKEDLRLETVLAELSADVVNLSWDGTVTQTAAGAGQPGKEELTVGGGAVLTERQWGFEGNYIDEDGALFPVRMFVWKGTATTGGALEWTKSDYVGIPLKVSALADMAKAVGSRLFKLQKILEPAV